MPGREIPKEKRSGFLVCECERCEGSKDDEEDPRWVDDCWGELSQAVLAGHFLCLRRRALNLSDQQRRPHRKVTRRHSSQTALPELSSHAERVQIAPRTMLQSQNEGEDRHLIHAHEILQPNRTTFLPCRRIVDYTRRKQT